MRRRIVNATMLCLAALGLAFVVPAAAFALVAPLTLPQLVAEADAIVEARVVSAHARQAPSAS
ncbi:MAG TPA: hypothetical protein VLA05_01095, partial [Coriobacteriia bacterium]|nr:hypothetical protein [Coriobacteriia bacterium]